MPSKRAYRQPTPEHLVAWRELLVSRPELFWRIITVRRLITERGLSVRSDICPVINKSYEYIHKALGPVVNDTGLPDRRLLTLTRKHEVLDEIEEAITELTDNAGGLYELWRHKEASHGSGQ